VKVERIQAFSSAGQQLLDVTGKVAAAFATLNNTGQLIYYFHGDVKIIITPKPKKRKA
jgi:hypothetical protein